MFHVDAFVIFSRSSSSTLDGIVPYDGVLCVPATDSCDGGRDDLRTIEVNDSCEAIPVRPMTSEPGARCGTWTRSSRHLHTRHELPSYPATTLVACREEHAASFGSHQVVGGER